MCMCTYMRKPRWILSFSVDRYFLYFLFVCMWGGCQVGESLAEVRRRHQIPWSWSYRQVWAVGVLRAELRSSVRTAVLLTARPRATDAAERADQKAPGIHLIRSLHWSQSPPTKCWDSWHLALKWMLQIWTQVLMFLRAASSPRALQTLLLILLGSVDATDSCWVQSFCKYSIPPNLTLQVTMWDSRLWEQRTFP